MENAKLIESFSARLTEVEELFTHLERTVGELDGVLRRVQARLDTLERRAETMNGQLAELADETDVTD